MKLCRFVILKLLLNGEITLLLNYAGKPCPSQEFLTWQKKFKCLLTLFVKIKFSQNFQIYNKQSRLSKGFGSYASSTEP